MFKFNYMWYWILSIGSGYVAYKFRYTLFMYAMMFLTMMKTMHQRLLRTEDTIKLVDTVELYCSDEYIEQPVMKLYKFQCQKDGKKHVFNVVSEEWKDMQIQTIENMEHLLETKNAIVFCSIHNTSGEVDLDTTASFREFAHHFHKDDHTSKLGYFFEYIRQKCIEKGTALDLKDLHFTLFLNDAHLTEKKVAILDVYNKTFKELLHEQR